MSIELPKDLRKEALTSIVRCFRERSEEQLENLAASGLLDFFIEEIGPSIDDIPVTDILEGMQIYIQELGIDFHDEKF